MLFSSTAAAATAAAVLATVASAQTVTSGVPSHKDYAQGVANVLDKDAGFGQCRLSIRWLNNGGKQNNVVASIINSGNTIGLINNNIDSGSAHTINMDSKLPYVLVIDMPAAPTEPISFQYANTGGTMGNSSCNDELNQFSLQNEGIGCNYDFKC